MINDFKQAFTKSQNGHIQLILINVIVFLLLACIYVITAVGNMNEWFFLLHKQFVIPSEITEFITRPWTIITYAFAHSVSDIFHILFNMLVLYWFGRLFVEYLGSDKLIALYVLGALAAAVVYLLVFNSIPYFKTISEHFLVGMVGSSGAVYAIMVGIATLLPNYTFYLLFFGPVRIKYIAIFYIVLSFIGSVGNNAGGNVAHLGGALMGYVYIKQLQVGVNWGGWITHLLQWIASFFKPTSKVNISYRKQSTSSKTQKNATSKGKESVSQEEINAILDKISEGGYAKLTQEEKKKLFEASKKK